MIGVGVGGGAGVGVSSATRAISGGWLGADLEGRPERWRLAMPGPVARELLDLAREFVDGDAAWEPRTPPPPVTEATRGLVAQLRRRLAGPPGFLLLTGFPVAERPSVVEAAYWLLGKLIGPPVSQTRDGDLIGRVEDRGADIGSPTQRGHHSASALAFHADRTDVIALLCVRPAAQGGVSRLVSSKALHDLVLAERPDLLPVLYERFPYDQRGEEATGRPAWCELPVFSRGDGNGDSRDFAARYVRRFIMDSQRHPRAPRLTDEQLAAMEFLDEVLERPGVALDMDLRPGDLQLINNFHLLHARSAFRDTVGDGEGRLLLRMWLSFAHSPTLPAEYADLYGDTAGGAYRGGVWPTQVTSDRVERGVQR